MRTGKCDILRHVETCGDQMEVDSAADSELRRSLSRAKGFNSCGDFPESDLRIVPISSGHNGITTFQAREPARYA